MIRDEPFGNTAGTAPDSGRIYDKPAAQFDLAVDMIEVEEEIVFHIEYCTRLFETESIRCFCRHMTRIIWKVVQNSAVLTADILLISDGEKQQILYEFNPAAAPYRQDKRVQELFEGQAD